MRCNRVIFFGLLFALVVAAGPAFGQTPEETEPVIGLAVIDPGHGGDDLGVTDPSGWPESRLTLSLAQQIKKALEDELGLRVYLTREEGQSPSLLERTALANRLKADLFVSIHAGGAREDDVSGYGVYYQSYRLQAGLESRLEEEIRENEPPGGPRTWETAQAAHQKASIDLARELGRSLSEVLRVSRRPPQGLPLAVLAGVDQPAVLLEVGYLTNAEEARRLRTPGYQEALTRAVVRGIKNWSDQLRGP